MIISADGENFRGVLGAWHSWGSAQNHRTAFRTDLLSVLSRYLPVFVEKSVTQTFFLRDLPYYARLLNRPTAGRLINFRDAGCAGHRKHERRLFAATLTAAAKVAIVMGSKSDWSTMEHAAAILDMLPGALSQKWFPRTARRTNCFPLVKPQNRTGLM